MSGFDIKNNTIWPMEISIGLLSPFYWGLTEPGQTLSRGTGAVWFTLQATVALDHKEHITKGQAVFEAFKGIFWHVKLGEWLVNSQMLATLNAIPNNVAEALRGGAPVIVKGKQLDKLPQADAVTAVQEIFTPDRARVQQSGCYAGWRGHRQYVVSGGPLLQETAVGVELVSGTPLRLDKM